MSGSGSNKRQPADQGGSRPAAVSRTIRSGTLLMLVLVDLIAALILLGSFVSFVIRPDPAAKAVPMYVTLALTTCSALLMAALAVNASFFPFMTRKRARDVRLVMWVSGATGIVTGILTLGQPAQGVVAPLFVGTIAFIFIRVQEARLDHAYTTGPPKQVTAPDKSRHDERPHLKSRQRRGGRKR